MSDGYAQPVDRAPGTAPQANGDRAGRPGQLGAADERQPVVARPGAEARVEQRQRRRIGRRARRQPQLAKVIARAAGGPGAAQADAILGRASLGIDQRQVDVAADREALEQRRGLVSD